MKAAQIMKYTKEIEVSVREVPVPAIAENEILIKTKVAAVNPLELLIISGSVKLIAPYTFPLTLGNELSGVVEKVGSKISTFKVGEAVYSRLPIRKIGAFAEYVAVDAEAVCNMPDALDFRTGAAIPLTGLTTYQGLREELQVEKGKTLFIPGGSGSFGQMAIPLAEEMGLKVIVSGNAASRNKALKLGAAQYLDYKTENYWEKLTGVDYVIDTLGPKEFKKELSVLKKVGKLLSLIDGPNRQFALDHQLPAWKKFLFTLAGFKFDRQARKKESDYRFIFVRSDGEQLKKISEIVSAKNIKPEIEATVFRIEEINEALKFVREGHPKGKVLIDFE